jgi:hypothetical protein
MEFDISVGLSSAGTSTAKTAEEANLAADPARGEAARVHHERTRGDPAVHPPPGCAPPATSTLPPSLIGRGGVSSQPGGP